MAKLKRNNVVGPEGIVIEMLVALHDFGIEKISDIIHEIYNSCDIPEDLSRAIFIALPEKPEETECKLQRLNSQMSYIKKQLFIRILMNRTGAESGRK